MLYFKIILFALYLIAVGIFVHAIRKAEFEEDEDQDY